MNYNKNDSHGKIIARGCARPMKSFLKTKAVNGFTTRMLKTAETSPAKVVGEPIRCHLTGIFN